MAILSKFNKVQAFFKALGWRGVFVHLPWRLFSRFAGDRFFRFIMVVLAEPRPTPAATKAGAHHTFRFATKDDLRSLLSDKASGIFERDLEAFDSGCRCLLQLDGEKLAGYTWVAGTALIEMNWGMHFNMPDDMMYNYNGYTCPAYRGTAFQALRHIKLLELTRHEGKTRLLGYVDHLNYKSLKGVDKSGYKRVGVLRGCKRQGRIHFSLCVNSDSWSEIVRAGPKQR